MIIKNLFCRPYENILFFNSYVVESLVTSIVMIRIIVVVSIKPSVAALLHYSESFTGCHNDIVNFFFVFFFKICKNNNLE